MPLPITLALTMAAAAGTVTAGQVDVEAVTPRRDRQVVTVAAAKAMSPDKLGDALLAAGHPGVAEASIGQRPMEPPAAPDAATRLQLYLKPTLSHRSGFCKQTVVTTHIQPASDDAKTRDLSEAERSITTTTGYRWIGEHRDASACAASRSYFFTPSPQDADQMFDAVRLLATASLAARRGHRLGFLLTVDDQEGREMLSLQKTNPDGPPIPDLTIIRDAKKALASLPVDQVMIAVPADFFYFKSLTAPDLAMAKRRKMETVALALEGNWIVGLLVANGRIERMRLTRRLPPPF